MSGALQNFQMSGYTKDSPPEVAALAQPPAVPIDKESTHSEARTIKTLMEALT